MYVTLSSTKKNERVNGKIQKYYIECPTYKEFKKAYKAVKHNGNTYYVHRRFSTPKYNEETHKIVSSYKDIVEFKFSYDR